MRCEDVQQLLEGFVTGDLPLAARQTIQVHLAECSGCRTKLATIDDLAADLVGTQAPPVPWGFASRVMVAARQRRRAEPVAPWDLTPRKRRESAGRL